MEELKALTTKMLEDNKLLRGEIGQLDKDFRKYRATARTKTMVFSALLAVACAVAFIAISTAFAQKKQRDEVLCPLYQIFVKSYNPNSLAAKADGIEAYSHTFAEIRKQYAVLGCSERVEPAAPAPATPAPSALSGPPK